MFFLIEFGVKDGIRVKKINQSSKEVKVSLWLLILGMHTIIERSNPIAFTKKEKLTILGNLHNNLI